MDLQVVIPSLGRADLVGKALALFPSALLCVPEREVEVYRSFNPDANFLPHPDDMIGMAKKRQFILDHCGAEVVFMLDDDVSVIICIVGHRQRLIRDPVMALQIIESTAVVAKGVGTVLFGFAHFATPMSFNPWRPFTFGGYCNGRAMGFVGRSPKITFDQRLVASLDIDISMQVLLRYRILWRDLRFNFYSPGTLTRPGGMARFRTAEVLARDHALLKQKWGDAIRTGHLDGNNKGTNVKIFVDR